MVTNADHDAIRAVLMVLYEEGPLRSRDIMARTDLSYATLRRILNRFEASGLVRRGARWRYSLIDRAADVTSMMSRVCPEGDAGCHGQTPRSPRRHGIRPRRLAMEQAVLDLLRRQPTASIQEMKRAAPGLTYYVINDLVDQGAMIRIAQGLYGLPMKATADPSALSAAQMADLRSRHEQSAAPVLEAIRQGVATTRDLRLHFRVTRQRIDKLLKKLMGRGLIERRIDPRTGRYVYSITPPQAARPSRKAPGTAAQGAAETAEDALLTAARQAILAAMPAHGWLAVQTLRKGAIRRGWRFEGIVDDLVNEGLLERSPVRLTTSVDRHSSVRLTSKGRQHPDRRTTIPRRRFKACKLYMPVPRWTAPVVRALLVLGPASTGNIRAACGLDARKGALVINKLCLLGVLRKVHQPQDRSGRTLYDLTAYAWAMAESHGLLTDEKLQHRSSAT